jgi:hypothetical protein
MYSKRAGVRFLNLPSCMPYGLLVSIVTVCVFMCHPLVTPWQLHDRKSRCLRGRWHSSILYSPSGFFSSYFINEVHFWHYKKYGSVGRFTVGKIIVYKFMIQFYSYLYFCQSYSWNKGYLINYSQLIHLVGNCHWWSIIGRCWYNDHRSWKWTIIFLFVNINKTKDRFPYV